MRLIATILLFAAPALMPAAASAFDLEEALRQQHPQHEVTPRDTVAQKNGMSLAEATESVRRRTNGRIVSAVTRVQGGREVHYIKVLTKDGKVRTHKVNGRRR